jgi:hypothetical protein
MRHAAGRLEDTGMTTYEFWRRIEDGEIFAVKLADGLVVACAGPLDHDDLDAEFLPALDYEADHAAAVEATRDGFVPIAVA